MKDKVHDKQVKINKSRLCKLREFEMECDCSQVVKMSVPSVNREASINSVRSASNYPESFFQLS